MFSTLVGANKNLMNAQLPSLYPAVLALTRSPLVAADARLTLDWLARCADRYEGFFASRHSLLCLVT